MSFREKREIFQLQHAKKIKFLPAVEMTASVSTASYGFIYTLWVQKFPWRTGG